MRIARSLDNLPLINKAFENGEISYSKVRAMTRVATDDNEDFLLSIAKHGSASHIEQLVRKFERVVKNQQATRQDLQQQRELIHYQNDDGMWVIHAKLPQEEGGVLIKAIEEVVRLQDKPMPSIPSIFGKNVSAETPPTETDTSEPEIIETANFAQQRADAICAMAEHYIASHATDKTDENLKSLAAHERCQVILHLDVDTLKHDHCSEHHATDKPHHLDNQWISPENAKRLSCDCSLLTVLEDKDGNVLNLSRNARVVTPPLKRALDIRDETCRFPGCCESRYVDFHHIQHWACGGETNPDNLVKLCRFHHRELHKGSFSIEVEDNRDNKQALIFKTNSGQVMEPNPRLPICTFEDYFEQQWPEIHSRTGIPYCIDRTMDYHLAVGSLAQRRERSASQPVDCGPPPPVFSQPFNVPHIRHETERLDMMSSLFHM